MAQGQRQRKHHPPPPRKGLQPFRYDCHGVHTGNTGCSRLTVLNFLTAPYSTVNGSRAIFRALLMAVVSIRW